MMDELRAMLIRQEDRRRFPYRDSVGKLTIGVGRNLDDKGLTDDEIDFLLDNDIREARFLLFKELPWAYQLDEPRQTVLLNMTFNMGIAGLLEFRRMLGAVETGDYKQAASEMLESRWAGQVGSRATYLAKIMETGSY